MDPNLANLTCPDGGNQCIPIQEPKIINTNTTMIWNNVTRTFICSNPTDCKSSFINCPNNDRCTVFCAKGACQDSIINCPIDADCSIICIGRGSCHRAAFDGPLGHRFTVLCDGEYACQYSSFHAENSSYFNLTAGISSDLGAPSVSIWVPEKNVSSKRAYIFATNASLHGFYGYSPVQFYALNGWEDIEIDYHGHDVHDRHGGIMHCHAGYVDSCWFDDDTFSCN